MDATQARPTATDSAGLTQFSDMISDLGHAALEKRHSRGADQAAFGEKLSKCDRAAVKLNNSLSALSSLSPSERRGFLARVENMIDELAEREVQSWA
jgi:hypothetical protein